MLRIEIENFMKQHNMKTIVLWMNEQDNCGIYCELKGGYLMDYTNHRVNRQQEIWGWIDYDGHGNADKKSWDNSQIKPFLRAGFRVDLIQKC